MTPEEEEKRALRRKKYREKSKRWRQRHPRKAWAVMARADAKRRSAKRGLPFTLTTEYVYSLLTDKCPVFGTEFVFGGNVVIGATSPTLDRIIPEKGYVEGNVVVISHRANSIKSAYTYEDLRTVADWLEAFTQMVMAEFPVGKTQWAKWGSEAREAFNKSMRLGFRYETALEEANAVEAKMRAKAEAPAEPEVVEDTPEPAPVSAPSPKPRTIKRKKGQ
jgi:hypothetical protein